MLNSRVGGAVIGAALSALLLVGPGAIGATSAAAAPTPPLDVDVTSNDGNGRIQAPGLSCAEGGDGAYWHYGYTAALPAGPGHGFSRLPGIVRLNLDLHSDEVRYPSTNAQPVPPNPNAFLLGNESTASLLNDRGTVRLRLSTGGGCLAQPSNASSLSTVDFDGIRASTVPTNDNRWSVESGTGAYEGAGGTGTFALVADVAPGADNFFDLDLDGSLTVPQPTLDVEVVRTFWGNLGIDYVSRRVSVAYRITNTGPGHAYGAQLAATVPQTAGTVAMGPTPQVLGDFLPGESVVVIVRYQLNVLPPPCQLIILGCNFSARVDVTWSDALDVLLTPNETLGAKAPLLPPPL